MTITEPDGEDDDLTDWERLQVLVISNVMRHGHATVSIGDFEVLIDYRDRLKGYASPQ